MKFAVCLERNQVFRDQPGPPEMKSSTWPAGRPAEAMDIVRELMAKEFHGLEPDMEITTALAMWADHVPAFPVHRTLTGYNTW